MIKNRRRSLPFSFRGSIIRREHISGGRKTIDATNFALLPFSFLVDKLDATNQPGQEQYNLSSDTHTWCIGHDKRRKNERIAEEGGKKRNVVRKGPEERVGGNIWNK